MTLYLKYRPKNLDELDLPDVRNSLKKIMQSGKIPHAFLFAGPRGTGKTSAARILAKIVNCEKLKGITPCGKCEQCVSIAKGSNVDVMEMDAASHRGIDDIRVLRDIVKLAPTQASKKIYIIDEAHMLTLEASNALLKTLEEPPAHVIFILATTNPEKLIDTIRSRATLITFRKATNEEVEHSLHRVVTGEKIKLPETTLRIIAEKANGSFRDGVKILEQFALEGEDFLNKNISEGVGSFCEALYKKQAEFCIKYIGELVKNGSSIEVFLSQVTQKIHEDIIADPLGKTNLIELAELLIVANRNISDSPIEELPLEIAVIKWCEEKKNEKPRIGYSEQNLSTVKSDTGKDVSRSMPAVVPAPAQTIAPDTHAEVVASLGEGVNDEVWKNILSLIKPVNASIEALLRAARPMLYDGQTLTLGVYYKFHKERLEDVQHRLVLEDIVGRVLNSPTKIVCQLVEPPVKKIVEEIKKEPVLTEGADRDIIKVAEEIFGN